MSSFTKILLLILATVLSGIVTLTGATVPFTRDSVYRKVYSSKTNTVLMEAESKSLKKCALVCFQHSESECSGFYFNSRASTCKLFQGAIPVWSFEYIESLSPHPIYRKVRQCPVSLGYKLIKDGSAQYCLGAFWRKPLKNQDAKAECKKHGGDLIFLNERYQTLYSLWDKVTDSIEPQTWIVSFSKYCMFTDVRAKKHVTYSTACYFKKTYTCEIVL